MSYVMPSQRTKLEARVRGVNRANAFANDLYNRFVEVLTPFKGQKIFLASGGLAVKVKAAIASLELPNTVNLHVYISTISHYDLVYVVKTCEQQDSYVTYYETSLYVAHLERGVHMGEFYPAPNFKTDHTADGVTKARADFDVARKAFETARSNLFPFGEYEPN